ncbi:DUF1566 domain-containing protein [Leptospira yasudae]|uniref:Lcl C-terminal domain-containing protein n=1 Tax=Leptospira yasudae TaxID=2202201 RepID=UPI0010830FE5|nr:DUF1566 domain-containing protein [Leptospira yasudae]TGK27045.1 DUF1566 domain-containing protein [Leptospira yasudae]TGM08161.1 DUF1566 domain-containing protein [Leptospira yasudae]
MKSLFRKMFTYLFTLVVFITFFVYPIYPLDGPFTDNLDGTIRAGSGRFWQKCSMGQGSTICNAPVATTTDWTSALGYCNTLGLAGRAWRLPTVKELQSLVDFGRTAFPIINVTTFPDTVGGYYWTSTNALSNGISPATATGGSDPKTNIETATNKTAYRIPISTPYRTMAYIVDFRMGGVIEFPKANNTKAYVRCVSGP